MLTLRPATRRYSFSSDAFTLSGTLHLPGNRPRPPVILGLHGLFADASSPKQQQMAKGCTACGWGYFRIDHRGCGQSSGLFGPATSFAGRCRDALAAADFLAGMGQTVCGLFGSSLGGAVALQTAAKLKVAAVVTVAAPIRSGDVVLQEKPDAPSVAGLSAENLAFDLSDGLKSLPALLLFHGEKDTTVPWRNAQEIFQKVISEKRLITFPGGDHRISRPRHQKQMIEEALAWFRMHLEK